MAIQIDLPKEIEDRLRATSGHFSLDVKEALLVELYRQGRISHGELAQGLDISRFEADIILGRHNVTEDLLTSDELLSQVEGIRKLVGR